MAQHKEDAELLRSCLVVGIASVERVVAWADSIVAAESVIDPGIIEISLSGNKTSAELVSLLHAVAGEANSERVMRRLLGEMYLKLKSQPDMGESIAASLYQLRCNGDIPEEAFGWEPYALSDTFHVARACGHCGNLGAPEDLIDYLIRHAIIDDTMA